MYVNSLRKEVEQPSFRKLKLTTIIINNGLPVRAIKIMSWLAILAVLINYVNINYFIE